MDVVTYALSRKYTDNSIAGISGVLAGKNCTIASITPVDGGNLVTFEWVADDSTTHTDTMFVQDGILGENDIAPTYDPTVTYSEGNLVVYNNELYRCTSATTGEFDPSDWESISINEILSEIEIALGTKANTSDLATVATSGSYTDLSNTPTIPDELADLTDDSTHRLVTDTEKSTWNAKQNALTFDNVPTDGSNNPVKSNGIYDALATKANISDVPTALADLSDDSTHRVVTDTEKTTWNAKSDFSGSYNDLTDTPTIPSDADDISYDNTESGLTADDVQGAIDEVNGNIVDVEANPSGTATGELETIKVGSTIYNIVGGEPVYGEASGAIASFSDGSANPLADLKIAINPVQSGSGDPSPSNPRPISGWTGANVHVADGETPHVIDNVVNVSWQTEAGTVYGGELDVTTGELTVKYIRYDLGDYSWVWITDARLEAGGAFRALPLDMKQSGYILADIYKCYPDTGFTELISRYGASINNVMTSNGNAIYVINSAYTDADDFKTAMDGKYMLYELATPITYQLTPTHVSTILGVNNIWTDTGDINYCKYQRDLNICINNIIDQLNS